MNTHADSVRREVHEFYLVQINNVIAEGREALISSLVADYDHLRREESESADEAA